MAEYYVNKLLKIIDTIAKYQEPSEITNDLVEIAIKKLKRKKASDEEKWTNEIILEGGDEITLLLCRCIYMF